MNVIGMARDTTKRVLLRGIAVFLSLAIPIAFIAYADHERKTVGFNWARRPRCARRNLCDYRRRRGREAARHVIGRSRIPTAISASASGTTDRQALVLAALVEVADEPPGSARPEANRLARRAGSRQELANAPSASVTTLPVGTTSPYGPAGPGDFEGRSRPSPRPPPWRSGEPCEPQGQTESSRSIRPRWPDLRHR